MSAGVWSKGGKYQDVLDGWEGRKEAKEDEGQVFILCGRRREGAAADPEGNREMEGSEWKERERLGEDARAISALPSEKEVNTEMRKTRRSGLPGRRRKEK